MTRPEDQGCTPAGSIDRTGNRDDIDEKIVASATERGA